MVRDFQADLLKAFVDVFTQCGNGRDVQKAALDAVGQDADRIYLRLRAYLVLLRDDFEYLTVSHRSVKIVVEQGVYDFCRNAGLCAQLALNGVERGHQALSADADIGLADRFVQVFA